MDFDLNSVLNDDVVVLWSGGIDSTGLIFVLLKKYGTKVHPIFLKHGQRNQEFEEKAVMHYSKQFSQEYGNRFDQVFIATSDIPPKEFKKINSSTRHYLRNSDLINNAVRYALYKNIKTIVVATFENDLKDGSKDYLIAKESEIEKGTGETFKVFSPFQHSNFRLPTKAELMGYCREEKFDISTTRSCYESTNEPCGECESCKRRAQAALGII